MKAEGREDRSGSMNAEKGAENKGADNKSRTVGQAGARREALNRAAHQDFQRDQE